MGMELTEKLVYARCQLFEIVHRWKRFKMEGFRLQGGLMLVSGLRHVKIPILFKK